jgi:hypothetical protein
LKPVIAGSFAEMLANICATALVTCNQRMKTYVLTMTQFSLSAPSSASAMRLKQMIAILTTAKNDIANIACLLLVTVATLTLIETWAQGDDPPNRYMPVRFAMGKLS